MISLEKIYSLFNKDKYKLSLFILLIFLSIFSIYVIRPGMGGDSVSYFETMKALDGQQADFAPYRFITTYFAMVSIMFVNIFVGNILTSWLIINSLLYVIMGMFFYSLLRKIVDDSNVAFLGTLFLATNYAAIAFSFRYLMDVGGWAFYVASLYFSFLYLEKREFKWLWISSALVGVGGLFKEYAYLASVVILCLIIFTEWKQWSKIIKHSVLAGLLSFGPMVAINVYSFFAYDYTYLSWLYYAETAYSYQSRLVEYVKSFGSLYNFGWFLFIGGAYVLLKRYREVFKDEKLLFIWSVVLSSTVVFVWPVVTRVLFITIPAVVLVTSLFIKKINKPWKVIFPILVLYILSSFLMDAYILDVVNIQKLFDCFI